MAKNYTAFVTNSHTVFIVESLYKEIISFSEARRYLLHVAKNFEIEDYDNFELSLAEMEDDLKPYLSKSDLIGIVKFLYDGDSDNFTSEEYQRILKTTHILDAKFKKHDEEVSNEQKYKEALEATLEKINQIHYESADTLKKLNEQAHNNPNYRNMNGMYDVDLSYMMNIGRFAWDARAKQIVGFYIRPILTKALNK